MTPHPHARLVAGLAALVALGATPARAQRDSLRLADLQRAALARDPRGRELSLLDSATALRVENVAVERRPQLSLTADAQHQSDVTKVSLNVPGAHPPVPPKDRWQAVLGVQQLLYDAGSIGTRQAVERARLAESREGVRVAQYRLRSEVDAAFFSAYLLQERRGELAALLADLDARLTMLRARVKEGAALPGDTAAVVAEMLRAEQSRDELDANRRAALRTLGLAVGVAVDTAAVLALPDRSDDVARLLGASSLAAARGRPEFAHFAQSRARLGREAELLAVERRPRVYAFGQAGYGRPGLDQFRTTPDQFWIAGVRTEWRPFDWRATDRQRETLRLQQRVVDTEEAAFAESLERQVQGDVEAMRRLRDALAQDERIIALREQVERQTRVQFDEGVVTTAEYVRARTDVLDARLAARRHRAELAQAEARILTTAGVP